MLILKIYPGQITWIAKDIQVTMLGNLQGFVQKGLQTGQNIKVGEQELWNKRQAYETL